MTCVVDGSDSLLPFITVVWSVLGISVGVVKTVTEVSCVVRFQFGHDSVNVVITCVIVLSMLSIELQKLANYSSILI